MFQYVKNLMQNQNIITRCTDMLSHFISFQTKQYLQNKNYSYLQTFENPAMQCLQNMQV